MNRSEFEKFESEFLHSSELDRTKIKDKYKSILADQSLSERLTLLEIVDEMKSKLSASKNNSLAY